MGKQDVTAAISRELGEIGGVIGVILFGSLARNERTDTSDIDILVVHDSDAHVPDLRAIVYHKTAELTPVSPAFFTPPALIREFKNHPSFAAHLNDEGRVTHRTSAFNAVECALRSTRLTREALQRELADRVEKLDLFSDLERFNGEFLPCLAQLYTIGKSVVIIKLLENDIHEYSWKRIFDLYSRIRPELNAELARLRDIRVCYELVRNRRSNLSLEWTRVDPDYVTGTIRSIVALAAS